MNKDINNELVRTPYELDLIEFVLSSLGSLGSLGSLLIFAPFAFFAVRSIA